MRELLKRLSIKKKRDAFLGAPSEQTRLHSLYRLELALTSTLNLQERLNILLEHTMKQMRADITAVFLIEPLSNDLAVIAQRGAKHFGSGYGFRLKMGEGAAGWIAQHQQPLAIPNVHEDARWLRVERSEEDIVSYLGVPLVVDGGTIGVLDVATRTPRIFDKEDVEFFKTLAGRAAISIRNAQMVEELRLYKNALNSAADAVAITNLQGQILDVNPSFERLTGYSRAESIGRTMSIVKSKHSTLEFYRTMWEEILANGHWIGEIVNQRKNGEEWRAWNAISTVRDESGKPIAYVGVNRDITDIRQTEAALSRRVKELEFLHRSALTMTATLDLDAALEQVLNLMAQEFGYPYLAIGLMDQESGRICLRAQRGIHPDKWGPNGQGLLPGQGLVGWAYQHGEPLLVNDVSLDPRYVIGIPETRSELVVPLRFGDRATGVINVESPAKDAFSAEDLRLLNTLAHQLAIAIENARLFEAERTRRAELDDAYLQTVFALANAIDAKDTYTGNHAQQLTAMALAVGREMGLSPREMEDLRYGAILHDIGKIGIPDAILQKPTALDEEEWKWMRQHPQIGARILAPIPRLSGAALIVRHHHERFDGAGYPDGLSGDAIPLVARILTVVDAYNAILDARPYKPPLPRETAIAELKKCAGTQFDAHVVGVFLQVLERGIT